MQEIYNFDIKKVLETAMEKCLYYYNKEEGFRIDVVNAIKEIYPKSFVICEYSVKERKESIDIAIFLEKEKYAVELKYRSIGKKEEFIPINRNEKYKITPACNMYEYIEDINKLSNLRAEKMFDKTYAVLLTNTKNYETEDKLKEAKPTRTVTKNKIKQKVTIEMINKKAKIKYINLKNTNGYYKKTNFYILYVEE